MAVDSGSTLLRLPPARSAVTAGSAAWRAVRACQVVLVASVLLMMGPVFPSGHNWSKSVFAPLLFRNVEFLKHSWHAACIATPAAAAPLTLLQPSPQRTPHHERLRHPRIKTIPNLVGHRPSPRACRKSGAPLIRFDQALHTCVASCCMKSSTHRRTTRPARVLTLAMSGTGCAVGSCWTRAISAAMATSLYISLKT